MSLQAAITGRRTAQRLKSLLSVLLLAFYVAGTSQTEVLHQFFDSHDHLVSHSAEQEKDPCHRSVYHLDMETGCGHHSHIVTTDKCELCDLIVHSDEILLSTFENSSTPFFTIDFMFCSSNIERNSQSLLSSRAPPTI
jgi:hypothetical protein